MSDVLLGNLETFTTLIFEFVLLHKFLNICNAINIIDTYWVPPNFYFNVL